MPSVLNYPYVFVPNTKIKSAEANADFSYVPSLNKGMKAGFNIGYVSAGTLSIGLGMIEVNGKVIQNTVAYNITFANIDTGSETAATQYYVYIDDSANTYISASVPTTDYSATEVQAGRYYHPLHTNWRCLGTFYNNSNSDIDQGTIQEVDNFEKNRFNHFMYRNLLINSNFDIWTLGTSFTNPANGASTANLWTIQKANGSGTAPSINISQDTAIPDFKSNTSMKLQVTSVGSLAAGMLYNVQQVINDADWQKFKGTVVSYSFAVNAPTGGFFGLQIYDGVSYSTAYYAGSGSWKTYRLENVTLSPSASQLAVNIVMADATHLPATGTYWFTQGQFNQGASALFYQPQLVNIEYLTCLKKEFILDSIGTVQLVSAAGDISTSFTKAESHKLLRFTFSGSVNSAGTAGSVALIIGGVTQMTWTVQGPSVGLTSTGGIGNGTTSTEMNTTSGVGARWTSLSGAVSATGFSTGFDVFDISTQPNGSLSIAVTFTNITNPSAAIYRNRV